MINIYQFRITLKGSKPTISRTILVKSSRTFYEFHHIIQITMGWENYHLFQFMAKGYCISDPSMVDYKEILDSKEIRLDQIFTEEGGKIEYEYDFGDGWKHTIKLEKILLLKLNEIYPVCIKGKGCCPPEDCGGIWGYQHLVEVMGNKKHPEYKEMKEWLGGDFDPEEFNIEEVNEELKDLENYIEDSMFEL